MQSVLLLRDSEQLQAVAATRTELLQTRGGCRRFERPGVKMQVRMTGQIIYDLFRFLLRDFL